MRFSSKAFFLLLLFANSRLIVDAQQDSTFTRLLFVGDIMQHGSQIRGAFEASSGRYSYDACLEEASKFFQGYDLVMGNLELTLAGEPYQGYPRFSAPSQLVSDLKNAGVDILAAANNHTGDHGAVGIKRTARKLDSLNMAYTGIFSDEMDSYFFQPLIINDNGVRLAIFNYTFETNLPLSKESRKIVSLLDSAKIKKQVAKARSLKPDLTIAFVHWGTEYQQQPDLNQEVWGDFLHSHGIDVIVGSHPHVIQPIEWNKDSGQLTAYSIGNFLSGQRERYQDGGLCLEIEVCKMSEKDTTFISDVDAHPSWVYKSQTAPAFYSVLFPHNLENSNAPELQKRSGQISRFISDSKRMLSSSSVDLRLDTTLREEKKLKTSYYQIGFALPRKFDELTVLLSEHPELSVTTTPGAGPTLGPFTDRREATKAALSLLEEASDLYVEYVIKSITRPEEPAPDSPSLPAKQ